MTSTINATIEGGLLSINVAGHGTIQVAPAAFSDEIVRQAVLHGFKQKIVDAAALSRNPLTGASATAGDKYHAMLDVVHQLSAGDWNRRATGDGMASAGLLVAALVRVTGNELAAVEATVKGWTPEQQAAMRADAAVAPTIATIKAERAAGRIKADAPKVDTGGLLAGLMGAPKGDPAAAPTATAKAKAKAKS